MLALTASSEHKTWQDAMSSQSGGRASTEDNLCDAANQSGEWIAPGVRGIFCDPKPPGKLPCPSIPK